MSPSSSVLSPILDIFAQHSRDRWHQQHTRLPRSNPMEQFTPGGGSCSCDTDSQTNSKHPWKYPKKNFIWTNHWLSEAMLVSGKVHLWWFFKMIRHDPYPWRWGQTKDPLYNLMLILKWKWGFGKGNWLQIWLYWYMNFQRCICKPFQKLQSIVSLLPCAGLTFCLQCHYQCTKENQ